MNPRVSVIIPVFNRAAYIGATIDSVLAQTCGDFEIIAIDDGSTDGSRAIVDGYGERVRVLEHPGRANRGQSAAINLGLTAARGDFIAILDSDDLWLPNKLALQVAFLDSNPDVGLVYANGWAIDQNGKKLYDIYGADHQELSDPARVLLDCYFFLPTNSLVRRAVIAGAGEFDETLRAAQDHDMAVRIAERTRLAYLPEKLFCYRRHPGSISHGRADVRWRLGFVILEKARARFPYPARILRRRRAVLHFRLAQCAVENRRWFSGASHALAAFLLDPLRSLQVVLGRERIRSPH
jgi:glycosyltransferase involved in cell wall biosynthesis